MTTTNSQEPTCCNKSLCWLLNVGANIPLPYKAHLQGAKFNRGCDQLMCGCFTLLQSGAHKLLLSVSSPTLSFIVHTKGKF